MPDATTDAATRAIQAIDERIDPFLRELRRAGRAASTLKAYRAELERAATHTDMSPAALATWLERPSRSSGQHSGTSRRERPPGKATVRWRATVWTAFGDFCVRAGHWDANPLRSIPRPRVVEKPIEVIDLGELQSLLEHLAPHHYTLTVFLVATGFRVNAALALVGQNLETVFKLGGPKVVLRARHKGDRERRHELDDTLACLLREQCRSQGWTPESDPDRRLWPLSRQSYTRALERARRRSRLVKTITPHHLRHLAARMRLELGADVIDVGAFLGHRDLRTTKRYLARLVGETDAYQSSVLTLLRDGRKSGAEQQEQR